MVDGETVTDAEGNIVYTSSEAGHYGEFTITVPAGTTEILVTNGLTVADGGSTVDRTVTLKGDANVEGASIPIIFCDYNKDKRGTPLDKLTFNSYVSAYSASPSVYTLNGDLNDDNRVNALDKLAFNAFMINGAFPAYAELALD